MATMMVSPKSLASRIIILGLTVCFHQKQPQVLNNAGYFLFLSDEGFGAEAVDDFNLAFQNFANFMLPGRHFSRFSKTPG
jgi:hypothetical protein